MPRRTAPQHLDRNQLQAALRAAERDAHASRVALRGGKLTRKQSKRLAKRAKDSDALDDRSRIVSKLLVTRWVYDGVFRLLDQLVGAFRDVRDFNYYDTANWDGPSDEEIAAHVVAERLGELMDDDRSFSLMYWAHRCVRANTLAVHDVNPAAPFPFDSAVLRASLAGVLPALADQSRPRIEDATHVVMHDLSEANQLPALHGEFTLRDIITEAKRLEPSEVAAAIGSGRIEIPGQDETTDLS